MIGVIPRETERYEPWRELPPADEWVVGVGHTLAQRMDERTGGLLLNGDAWEIDCFSFGVATGAWRLVPKKGGQYEYWSAFAVPREMFDAEPERWLAEIIECFYRSAGLRMTGYTRTPKRQQRSALLASSPPGATRSKT